MRVAVMVACYNRREMSKRCLEAISRQSQALDDMEFDIYVYDDNSTDGTVEMINTCFPEITLIEGDGNAYWCKSMHYLMQLTAKRRYDIYVMINDDVNFYPSAMEIMFSSYFKASQTCGIVGATRSAFDDKVTYGGRDRNAKLLVPNGEIQHCVWANWNCFLIDNDVIEKIGIIDGKYQHSWGDFDFSHRMIKAGLPIYEAIEYIGECERNSNKGTYRDADLNKVERVRKMLSPKGMPIYSFFRYNIKQEGLRGIIKAIYGYCSTIAYIVLNREIQ